MSIYKRGNANDNVPCQASFCYFMVCFVLCFFFVLSEMCSPRRCQVQKDQLCTSGFEHTVLSTALSQVVVVSELCFTCGKEQEIAFYFSFIYKRFNQNNNKPFPSLLHYRSVLFNFTLKIHKHFHFRYTQYLLKRLKQLFWGTYSGMIYK